MARLIFQALRKWCDGPPGDGGPSHQVDTAGRLKANGGSPGA